METILATAFSPPVKNAPTRMSRVRKMPARKALPAVEITSDFPSEATMAELRKIGILGYDFPSEEAMAALRKLPVPKLRKITTSLF